MRRANGHGGNAEDSMQRRQGVDEAAARNKVEGVEQIAAVEKVTENGEKEFGDLTSNPIGEMQMEVIFEKTN